MKRFFTYGIAVLLLSSFAFFNSIDEVVNCLKNGDAAQLARFFDNTIEITMPDKSSNYSKNQAEVVLKDFFVTNGVKAFQVLHKGENTGSQYCIGTLVTKNGSFRTTVFMKQKGDRQLLQGIRLENQ
jgi:Domain of unknown function (DUF4783)